MLWHEQSWPQIQKLDKNLPVLIPLGSCEQHGHHLPLFVDTLQIAAIAQAVEQRLADRILMTPPLWLGSSHHHLDFPGTISVRPALYTQLIQDLARCILNAGFKRLFFLNGHGGNQTPVAQALSELVAIDDHADAANLATASWWQVGEQALDPDKLGMSTAALSHACEYETSLTLFLRPDLVDQAKARDVENVLTNQWIDGSTKGGRVAVFHRFHRFTAPGNLDTPSAATKDKGQAILHGVVDQIVAFLHDFATWPLLPIADGPTTPTPPTT